jgi:diguanylate cyclase (GGDEF)-like protein/putative nucleotidyltransferase with HDIG domain
MTRGAKLYLTLIIGIGCAVVASSFLHWHSSDLNRFFCYLLASVLMSGLKVSLPGINGCMSVNVLCLVLSVLELDFSEAVLIGCLSAIGQSFWKAKPKPVQVAFNAACVTNAVALAYRLYHIQGVRSFGPHGLLPLLLIVAAYFITNTVPIAGIISLTEGRTVRKIWSECYFWSFPYYLVGGAMAALISMFNRYAGWQTSLLVMPVVFFIYRAYRLYFGRLEAEKTHVSEMAGLHLRTIEALALAISAKDNLTHEHLRRVQVYAVEIGKELGVSELELEAIRAAALLHDIGKLAVPEHILSKPGKLRPEEFEKLKIHPVVGAEILAQVEFPYPVVPIVRSHHEKWDGSGYPDGLRGEEIPIGARILTAVDCLDALASDRPYRKALPLDEAMLTVSSEVGRSFDPRVIEVLQRRYVDLENQTKKIAGSKKKLSTDLRVLRGAAPGAGFESVVNQRVASTVDSEPGDFLSSIAAARQEFHMLYEATHDLGNSLSLSETLSVLAVRLQKMIAYDAIAIFIAKDRNLVAEYSHGESFRQLSTLEIPFGEGLSGWVAANQKPILNGDASADLSHKRTPNASSLQSALVVPLIDMKGTLLGVLSLYASRREGFTSDHLRILLAISVKVGLALGNALRYEQAETSATTDGLTGLPNAKALFIYLNNEISRAEESNSKLTVLVSDLDGFKQVNDRFGHLEGNNVLRMVSERFSEMCGESSYVARMGGDEFVFVLRDFSDRALSNWTERMADIAMAAGRKATGEDILSISIGAANYPRHGTDAERLLGEADRRMYAMKGLQKVSAGNHSPKSKNEVGAVSLAIN